MPAFAVSVAALSTSPISADAVLLGMWLLVGVAGLVAGAGVVVRANRRFAAAQSMSPEDSQSRIGTRFENRSAASESESRPDTFAGVAA